MNGTIVSVTRRGGTVTGTVRVDEGPPRGVVEYTAVVPAVDQNNVPYANSEIKAALVAAWRAQRAGPPPPPADLTAFINGTVTL